MKPYLPFESSLVPLPMNNIDTDQIIPARFLKTTSKEGLDKNLFCDWRQDPNFILNTPRGQNAQILLAGGPRKARSNAAVPPDRLTLHLHSSAPRRHTYTNATNSSSMKTTDSASAKLPYARSSTAIG